MDKLHTHAAHITITVKTQMLASVPFISRCKRKHKDKGRNSDTTYYSILRWQGHVQFIHSDDFCGRKTRNLLKSVLQSSNVSPHVTAALLVRFEITKNRTRKKQTCI